MQPIDADAIVRSPWLAGAMGALVALHGVPGATWVERAFNVFAGLLIAGYVSPAIAEYLGLASVAMQSAAAFLCGLFGLNGVAAVVAAIRSADLRDFLPWKR